MMDKHRSTTATAPAASTPVGPSRCRGNRSSPARCSPRPIHWTRRPVPVEGVDGYGRPDNATRRRFEAAIGDLEGGECLSFASGMAAVSAALLALVRPGDTILLPADGYYKTRAWATAELAPRGVTVLTTPTAGPYPSFDGIRLVLLETPANPGLDVCDIAELAAAAHRTAPSSRSTTPPPRRSARRHSRSAPTSSSPAERRRSPATPTFSSGTWRRAIRDLMTSLRSWRDSTGGIPGAFDCWLAHRSLATLDLRLARQTANARAVAEAIVGHPAVASLRWPGLPDDPAHEIATKQMRRIPGVLTFTLPSAGAVTAFFLASKLVTAATSFGGLHTTADRRAQWGDDTPDGLVRLSCGIEDPADLVADITSALDRLMSP